MEIVFATHNNNKLLEVKQILPNSFTIFSLNEINCFEEIIEDADTIEGNALIKARHVFNHYGKSCFSDDTGLFVNALDGEPGVYSARYDGEEKSANANNQKLLENLKNKRDRSAYFKTVIALKTPTIEKVFEGICKGKIVESPKGKNGFGYDPIFVPAGYSESFAELSPQIKNTISHRGNALKVFREYLKNKF